MKEQLEKGLSEREKLDAEIKVRDEQIKKLNDEIEVLKTKKVEPEKEEPVKDAKYKCGGLLSDGMVCGYLFYDDMRPKACPCCGARY